MTVQRHASGAPAPHGHVADAAEVHARTGRAVPDATVARLATYFRVLGGFRDGLAVTVSSDELAAAAGVNSAMLRKDLSYLGSYGIRGVGYDVITLTEEIARVLGLTVHRSVALIGVGNLGQALAGYSGFASRGFRIAALLDADPARIGSKIRGLVVQRRRASRKRRASREHHDRRPGHPGCCGAGGLRPAGRRRRHQHPELRAGRAERAGARRRPPGRPGRRAADSLLPREPQGRRDAARRGRWSAMSVLVVGLSYKSAPVSVLESASVSTDDVPKLLDELRTAPAISEVLLLSTCNRIEVYADVARFHPALAEISGVLARHAGLTVPDLGEHLYVHFAEAAVGHLFSVAAGLDSMVVGESQILGQLRSAYAAAGARVDGRLGAARPRPDRAARRQARAHRDRHRPRRSVHRVGRARPRRGGARSARRPTGGHRRRWFDGRAGRQPPFDAGGFSISRWRTAPRSGPGGWLTPWAVGPSRWTISPAEIANADLLVSATGATGLVLPASAIGARAGRPLVIVDIALPRDVDPAVAARRRGHLRRSRLPAQGRRRSSARPKCRRPPRSSTPSSEATSRPSSSLAVAPTVTALRSKANQVIDAELLRLDGRLPLLDPTTRDEVADAVRRAVEKVLHAPTVRVKELATTTGRGQVRRGAARAVRSGPGRAGIRRRGPDGPGAPQ